MSKLLNLMVATDIDGQGGIATVLSVYRDSEFFKDNDVRFIPTHVAKSRLGRAGQISLFGIGVLRVLVALTFTKVGLVHIHMASRGSYTRKSFIVRLVKLFRGRVVLHLHGGEFRAFFANESNPRKQQHIRRTFELADRVIVLSTQWIEWAQSTFSRSSHFRLLHNSVPSQRWSPSDDKKPRIVFLGRVGKQKGIADLLEAMVTVNAAVPDAELIVGGDGDINTFRAHADSLGLSSSVEFRGWIEGQNKCDLLASAAIYCLPSYNEGFPMGVLEAMSAGVAVVSTTVGGIPDAIDNEINGLLVSPGDTQALASALIDLLQHDEKRERLVTNAKIKFEENFSVEAVMPKLQSIYDELLDTEVNR